MDNPKTTHDDPESREGLAKWDCVWTLLYQRTTHNVHKQFVAPNWTPHGPSNEHTKTHTHTHLISYICKIRLLSRAMMHYCIVAVYIRRWFSFRAFFFTPVIKKILIRFSSLSICLSGNDIALNYAVTVVRLMNSTVWEIAGVPREQRLTIDICGITSF